MRIALCTLAVLLIATVAWATPGFQIPPGSYSVASNGDCPPWGGNQSLPDPSTLTIHGTGHGTVSAGGGIVRHLWWELWDDDNTYYSGDRRFIFTPPSTLHEYMVTPEGSHYCGSYTLTRY